MKGSCEAKPIVDPSAMARLFSFSQSASHLRWRSRRLSPWVIEKRGLRKATSKVRFLTQNGWLFLPTTFFPWKGKKSIKEIRMKRSGKVWCFVGQASYSFWFLFFNRLHFFDSIRKNISFDHLASRLNEKNDEPKRHFFFLLPFTTSEDNAMKKKRSITDRFLLDFSGMINPLIHILLFPFTRGNSPWLLHRQWEACVFGFFTQGEKPTPSASSSKVRSLSPTAKGKRQAPAPFLKGAENLIIDDSSRSAKPCFWLDQKETNINI